MQSFRTPEVERLTGVSRKTLHTWAVTGFLRPSVQEARGTGTRRLYGFNDLLAVRVVVSLRRSGISLQCLRKVADFVRSKGVQGGLGGSVLVTDGKDVYLREGNTLVSALRNRGQKLLFAVVDLGGVMEELKEAVLRIRPPAEDAPANRGRASTAG